MSHYENEREKDMSPFESRQQETPVRNTEWEAYVTRKEKEDSLRPTTAEDEKKTPKHYDSLIQPIEYMYEIMTHDEYLGFCRGNVLKYISRYPEKGGQLDLEKASYYLEELKRVY